MSAAATTTVPSMQLSPDIPAMIIRALTPSVTIFSMPFTRLNNLYFGLRCTAVRMRTGSLAIFSACPLTPTVLAALTALSPDPQTPTVPNVRYLIAPDIQHHLNIGQWKQAFPHAQILAPDGLREKRAAMGHADASEPYAHVWTAGPNKWTDEGKFGTLPAEFKDEFDLEYCDAHSNKELALLHRPDGGTLLEADLLFNLPGYEQYSASSPPVNPASGLGPKIMNYLCAGPKLGANGTVIPGSATGHRRFVWWLFTSKKDRKKLAESAKVVSGWEFCRIIPCHGEVIEDGDHKGRSKDTWNEVYKWNLDLLS